MGSLLEVKDLKKNHRDFTAVQQVIGVVPQALALYKDLTARESHLLGADVRLERQAPPPGAVVFVLMKEGPYLRHFPNSSNF